jgi:hypothetical protein
MYAPFHEMPDDARIWIYQADRRFSAEEHASIESDLLHLCQNWLAHGAPLKTSFRIDYNQFITLAVDERNLGASGCSIDGTVRLLKSLQQRLGMDFFDRESIAFLDGSNVKLYPLSRLKTLFMEGVLSGESVTFNNTLTKKAEWEKEWKAGVKNSWLARYLPKPAGAIPGP